MKQRVHYLLTEDINQKNSGRSFIYRYRPIISPITRRYNIDNSHTTEDLTENNRLSNYSQSYLNGNVLKGKISKDWDVVDLKKEVIPAEQYAEYKLYLLSQRKKKEKISQDGLAKYNMAKMSNNIGTDLMFKKRTNQLIVDESKQNIDKVTYFRELPQYSVSLRKEFFSKGKVHEFPNKTEKQLPSRLVYNGTMNTNIPTQFNRITNRDGFKNRDIKFKKERFNENILMTHSFNNGKLHMLAHTEKGRLKLDRLITVLSNSTDDHFPSKVIIKGKYIFFVLKHKNDK